MINIRYPVLVKLLPLQGKSMTGTVEALGKEVERQGRDTKEGTGLAKRSWNLPCGPDSSEEFPDGIKS